MRPTGKLHLGHLVGALENWVALQSEFENYHLIADYHALTTNLDSHAFYENSIDMLIDWLAAGIDPGQSPVFRQSQDQGAHGAASPLLACSSPRPASSGTPPSRTRCATSRSRTCQLRPSRLSGPAGRGHPPVQGGRRAGRRGPGAARRDHARDRTEVQRAVRRWSSRSRSRS